MPSDISSEMSISFLSAAALAFHGVRKFFHAKVTLSFPQKDNLKPYDPKIRPAKVVELAQKSMLTPVADVDNAVVATAAPEIESDGGVTTGFQNASDGLTFGVVTGTQ